VDLMFYILQLVNIPKYIIKLRIAKSLRLFCFNINEKNVFEKNDLLHCLAGTKQIFGKLFSIVRLQ